MTKSFIKLKELERQKIKSIDPSKHPKTNFSLYSIPAYDLNKAEIKLGRQIGSSKKILENNDVLLSKIIPHIRRVWVIDDKDEYKKIGSGEWIIYNNKKIYPSYLKHYFLSDIFHSKYMNTVSGVGGSLKRARPKLIGEFDFILLPITEQKRIADILDLADNINNKRKQSLIKLEELIQSFYKKLFSKDLSNLSLYYSFDEVIVDVTKNFLKVKSKDYKLKGTTPIVDQGVKEICGYSDFKLKKNNFNPPYIIFGDHTKRLKFIDYEFILGADGTKVLKAKIDIDYTYLYYFLKSLKIKDAGYARHFKFLKSNKILIPSMDKQKKFSTFVKNCEKIINNKQTQKINEELLSSLKNSFFN